jgi:hypothetical protein
VTHIRATIAALATLALSACVVAPYPYYSSAYDQPVAVADVPPPAPYAEVVPAIPYVGAVWLSGYWGWSGHRHQWVPGRWEQPRPGYYWRPHRWEPMSGRWHLRGGGWVAQR